MMINGAPRLKPALKPSASLSNFEEIKMASLANMRTATSEDSGQQPVADSNATSVNKKDQLHKITESLTQLTLTLTQLTRTLEQEVARMPQESINDYEETMKRTTMEDQLWLKKHMIAKTKEAGILDPATRTLEDYKETVKQMPKEARKDYYSSSLFTWHTVCTHFMAKAKEKNHEAVLKAIENHYQDVKKISELKAKDLDVVLDEQQLQHANLHSLSHMIKNCRVDSYTPTLTRITITTAANSSAEKVAIAIFAFLRTHAKGKYKAQKAGAPK